MDSSESGGSPQSPTGKAGSMARFAISGDHLYTVTNPGNSNNSELTIFNIANEKNLVKGNKIPINHFVETIFPKDDLLFFGTRTGMLIYDRSTPTFPTFISEYSHIYSCDPVVVQKNYAYVTLNSLSNNCGRLNNRLDIIDISNIYAPKLVKEYEMNGPRGLGIDAYNLFVCDNGLKAYRVTDNVNLELINTFDVIGYDVIPDDGFLLMIGENGFYQYKYDTSTVKFLSAITID